MGVLAVAAGRIGSLVSLPISAAQCIVDGGADPIEISIADHSDVSREHRLGNGMKSIAVDR
jgi:hypothetical protein